MRFKHNNELLRIMVETISITMNNNKILKEIFCSLCNLHFYSAWKIIFELIRMHYEKIAKRCAISLSFG